MFGVAELCAVAGVVERAVSFHAGSLNAAGRAGIRVLDNVNALKLIHKRKRPAVHQQPDNLLPFVLTR